jgi:hypothetical protein
VAACGCGLSGFNVDSRARISESHWRARRHQIEWKRGNVNWIERFFVRAKHWQLFLLFVVVFDVAHFPIIGNLTAALKTPEGSAVTLLLTEFATAMAGWGFILWLWSLGSFLNSIVPIELRPKRKLFLFAVVCLAACVPASMALFQSIDSKLFVAAILLPFLALFCLFYSLYFVGKNLAMAETGKPATYVDWAGPAMLLWFCLIGVWLIQPRINRLYAEKGSTGSAAQATAI